MLRVDRLASTVLLALTFAACSDATGPAGPAGPDFEYAVDDFSRVRDTTPSTPHYALRHAATAPGLSTYQASFWAKRGEERSVTVSYGNDGPTYLTFTVPRMGLERGLDGHRLSVGDSVLISLQLDPVAFQVEFEPSGLQFSKKNPATLRVWYGFMDPDVNRDGSVDAADQTLMQSGVTYYHFDTGGINWKKISSLTDPVTQTIETAVDGFSGYVISW